MKESTISSSQLIQNLLRKYPSGIILGDVVGVVGPLSLTIQKHDTDGNTLQHIYKPGEQLGVIRIEKEVLVFTTAFSEAKLSPLHFSSFLIK